jgi:hypothetical protein
MTSNDTAFLAMAVGAFGLFGGVLARASWMEWSAGHKPR